MSKESVAFWLKTSSASVCCRLNLFLHSVKGTVNAMYATMTRKVMMPKYHV